MPGCTGAGVAGWNYVLGKRARLPGTASTFIEDTSRPVNIHARWTSSENETFVAGHGQHDRGGVILRGRR
jgi:hypothetical protein